MVELEDVYSENDKYLIGEYQKHGTDDFFLAELGDKAYVVPYAYIAGTRSISEAKERFLNSLLDFNLAEEDKYRQAGEPVFAISYKDARVVVPYGKAGEYASAEELGKSVLAKADAKYNTVINAGRMLAKAGHPVDKLHFSTPAAESYAERLGNLGLTAVLDKDTPERLDVMEFLHHAGNKTAKKFKTSVRNMATDLGKKIIEAEKKAARNYIPKSYKAAGLAVLLGAGAATMMLSQRGCSDSEQPRTEQKARLDSVYTDFMGEVHSDKFGNIQRIQEWQPEITALLVAVEGFADTAFKDGGGVPTIGSGTTFYLGNDGSENKVRIGDSISASSALAYKWRYIDKYMIDNFGDSFGRQCTKEEAMAGIGAGFCWGQTAFKKSKFLQSMKDGEDKDLQLRKLSGFRKQKGLLKRSYVLACCLAGEWTAKDLLDLPVYYLKDKGYVHCAIYTLDLHELLPCEKDKKGNYLKDKQGNDRPLVCEDDFCHSFYLDRAQDIKDRLIAEAEQGNTPYKTVRELMPEDMLRLLEPERFADEKLNEVARGQEKNDATAVRRERDNMAMATPGSQPDKEETETVQARRTFVTDAAMFYRGGRGRGG